MISVNLIGQLVGIVPLILAYFVFAFDDRRKIIMFKTSSDLLWALHFLLLGELSGAIVNLINTVRNLIFSQKEKKWCQHIFIPVFFCILTVICTFLSGDGIKSLFPAIGSCLAVIGFWCSSPQNIRRFNLPAVTLWLIYGIITGSVSTIISNSLSIISIMMPKKA